MQPRKQEVRELILPVFTQWSKVGAIQGILAELENGNFYDGALLVDQMLRDDRVRAVLDVRINSVLGSPLHFEPARDIAKGRKIAEDAEKRWSEIAPREELALLYRWGLMLGVGIARREWKREQGEWLPTLKTWHPGALWYSLGEDVYYLRHQGGQIPIAVDDPNWVLFTPYGYKYGRQQGLVRALAMPFLGRQWAFRDRARYSEVHGQPIRQGITPVNATKDERKAFKSDLAGVGSETVVITPQGEEGKLYDVKFVEASGKGSELFSSEIEDYNESIAIVVLGQSMSTTGQSGLGSQEKAGDSVRSDVMRFDAVKLRDLGRITLRPWTTYNYGDETLTPAPCFEVDPPEDESKKAATLNTLGDAIAKLEKHGLDARAALEQTGAPMLSKAETEKRRQELAEEAMNAEAAAQKQSPTNDAGNKNANKADTDKAAD